MRLRARSCILVDSRVILLLYIKGFEHKWRNGTFPLENKLCNDHDIGLFLHHFSFMLCYATLGAQNPRYLQGGKCVLRWKWTVLIHDLFLFEVIEKNVLILFIFERMS